MIRAVALAALLAAAPAPAQKPNRTASFAGLDGAMAARLAPIPQAPAATLTLTSGRAFRRCVNIAKFRERCLTTVELAATLETAGTARPIAAAVTRGRAAGARCLHMEPATAPATREAIIALLAAATAPDPGP